MPPSVLIVGAGQLGSRYLQGLADVDHGLKITVVDPSPESLDLARQRLAVVTPAATHEVHFTTSLHEAPKQLDLALVVTPAHCRTDVVAAITARHEVNAWILEKVLAQSSQQVDQIESSVAANSRVWVNIPRRLMPWHQAIKQQIPTSALGALRMRISGCNWDLASSAIHFIDLLSWWTDANVEYVDCRSLEDWQPSKRSGFHDVLGTLVIGFCNGSTLQLHSSMASGPYQPLIEIETPKGIWLIDEGTGKAVGPSGQQILGQLSFQSSLTAPLAMQILAGRRCELPTLSDSAAQHRPLLDALLQHWNLNQSRHDLVVPIT